MKRASLVRILLLFVVIGALALAAHYRGAIDADALSAALYRFGNWAPIAFIVLFALATVAFLPGMVFALVGGAIFGPVLGTLYGLTGATIGAVLAFWSARYLASGWVRQKTGPALDRIIRGVEREGWRFVAFTRLVPLFPFNLLNYALGLTRIRFSHYAATTALCMAPGAIAYNYLGYAGREVAAGGAGAIRSGLVALGLLAAVMFLPRLARSWREGKGRITSTELKRRLGAGEVILVIDVRDPTDFCGERGHIPGAKNIPLAQLRTRLGEIEAWRERPLAVVCRSDQKSGKAAALLRAERFGQILLVEDGMAGWWANQFDTA